MKFTFSLILFLGLCTLSQAQNFDSPTKKQHLKQLRRGLDVTGDLPFDPALKPFYHGVASGDPLHDRVILWTRITPDRQLPRVPVRYTVATSPAFRPSEIVARGIQLTDVSRDYTVKIDVTGLKPATTYYYYFSYRNTHSMVGRTRTAPEVSSDQLKFAVVSCSNYQAGYFNAYRAISQQKDLDAVIHLGDYIYEYGAGEGTYGYDDSRSDRAHIPDTEILTLADYRTRYSLYRLDSDLQAAHQQHPFIPIWDDHESANDAYANGAENHNEGEGSWEVRKAISKKVYFEWMPIREQVNEAIYRTISYGDLADMILIDTRLEGRDKQINDVTNPALYAPDRTLLGNNQETWLKEQLLNSRAKWKVIANQVIFSEFHVGWAASGLGQSPEALESQFLDIWDGYPAERNSLIDFIGTNDLDDVVILTGDFHSTFAYDVAKFPSYFSLNDPLNTQKQVLYDPTTGAGSVAVEFATPSITSANFDENLEAAAGGSEAGGDALANGFEQQINQPLPAPFYINPNPHLKYVDLDQHGYFILDLQPEKAQADWYFMQTIFEKNSQTNFAQGVYTEQGANHLQLSSVAALAKDFQPELAPEGPLVRPSPKEQLRAIFLNVYPNPVEAGHLFCINYALLEGGHYLLRLLDSDGKPIKVLMEGALATGNHTFTDVIPATLKAGIYYLHLQSNTGVQLTQRLLIK